MSLAAGLLGLAAGLMGCAAVAFPFFSDGKGGGAYGKDGDQGGDDEFAVLQHCEIPPVKFSGTSRFRSQIHTPCQLCKLSKYNML
jgi:hypothetical protein